MQRQEIEQSLYQQAHLLLTEDLEDVLRFVEFVRFKNEHKTPNQETIKSMQAAERGEYETVSLMIYTSNGMKSENSNMNTNLIPDLFDKDTALLGILDSECRIIDINDKALELVGLKKDDVLNQYFPDTAWWIWTNVEERKMLVDTLQNALLGHSSSFETSHLDIDGNKVRVLFMANPVFLENGGRVSVIGITELF